ncbi:MAG TPA: YceI family protein [Solirubrobacteraceae bacterium]|jgi:polyisoprenoid-binding protein YceI
MSIQAGTHEIGPSNGSLKVKTGREGAMAKMGHDLVIEVTDWSGTVTVGDGACVELTANPSSIQVVSGEGGAKALSEKDKGDIKKGATGKVLGSSPITFKSSEASFDGGSGSARGDLSIAGKSDSVNVPLQIRDDGTVSGSIKLSQSSFGIKQFSAMMGALKVKDSVEVLVEAKLPTG